MPGNNVQRFRESLMMSKAELARKAGLSTLTIDRIEAGRPCRLDTKRKILLALGLKVSDKDEVFGAAADAPSHWRRAAPPARRRCRRNRFAGPERAEEDAVQLPFGLGKSKSIVGLDIGSSSVKAVEMRRQAARASSCSTWASRSFRPKRSCRARS